MSIRVTVNSVPKNRISINSRRTEIIGENQKYLSGLLDVDTSDADNNETLVYDANTGKYVVKTLPVLNGGTF